MFLHPSNFIMLVFSGSVKSAGRLQSGLSRQGSEPTAVTYGSQSEAASWRHAWPLIG